MQNHSSTPFNFVPSPPREDHAPAFLGDFILTLKMANVPIFCSVDVVVTSIISRHLKSAMINASQVGRAMTTML